MELADNAAVATPLIGEVKVSINSICGILVDCHGNSDAAHDTLGQTMFFSWVFILLQAN